MIVQEIDLSRGGQTAKDYHRHPDIQTGVPYLALIREQWHIGHFEEVWYGWNFRGGPWPVGLQFDTPGQNHSRWERLFELMPFEDAVKAFEESPLKVRDLRAEIAHLKREINYLTTG